MAQEARAKVEAPPGPRPGEIFPFMSLAPEIRTMIYEALLIVPYTLPYWPRDNGSTSSSATIKPQVAILRVSKTINAEATPILYSKNCFATSHYDDSITWESKAHKDSPLNKLPRGKGLKAKPKASAQDIATNAKLDQDVSKIFTKHRSDLPKWLFGAAYLRNPETSRLVKRPKIPGYSFARFLRQIGSRNAKEIKSLQLTSWARYRTRQACYELPLYSEIIRQHMYNVQYLSFELGARAQDCSESRSLEWESIFDWTISPAIALREHQREARRLEPILLAGTRNLILTIPNLHSVAVQAECKCFPKGYGRMISKEIEAVFQEREATAVVSQN
ncbi:MAG: hypothetical protein Q9225_007563 [Loekoesia sp. 1 TL-2023]